MIEYTTPSYEKEGIETNDVIASSAMVQLVGQGTVGNLSGPKAEMSMDYSSLFGVR